MISIICTAHDAATKAKPLIQGNYLVNIGGADGMTFVPPRPIEAITVVEDDDAVLVSVTIWSASAPVTEDWMTELRFNANLPITVTDIT